MFLLGEQPVLEFDEPFGQLGGGVLGVVLGQPAVVVAVPLGQLDGLRGVVAVRSDVDDGSPWSWMVTITAVRVPGCAGS